MAVFPEVTAPLVVGLVTSGLVVIALSFPTHPANNAANMHNTVRTNMIFTLIHPGFPDLILLPIV
jgi:hypothetical protein